MNAPRAGCATSRERTLKRRVPKRAEDKLDPLARRRAAVTGETVARARAVLAGAGRYGGGGVS